MGGGGGERGGWVGVESHAVVFFAFSSSILDFWKRIFQHLKY